MYEKSNAAADHEKDSVFCYSSIEVKLRLMYRLDMFLVILGRNSH